MFRDSSATKQRNLTEKDRVYNLRLHWIGQRVQPVFNLACVLANSIKWARVVGGICATGPAKRVLVAEVITRGATDVGHGEECAKRVIEVKRKIKPGGLEDLRT